VGWWDVGIPKRNSIVDAVANEADILAQAALGCNDSRLLLG